jgi:dCTP deaminase
MVVIMSFISWKTMKRLIDDKRLIKNPKKEYKKLNDFSGSGASLDLCLGEQLFLTQNETSLKLAEDQTVDIKTGQFAVLTTEEILDIPNNYLGFITIRFQYKSKGLINISGFHVDPGFKGKLIFSVYNIGPKPVTLKRGYPIFSLFLATIEDGAKYDGIYQNLDGIPSSIILPLVKEKVTKL